MTKLKYTFFSILAVIAAWFGWNLYAVDTGLSWVNPTTYTDGTTIPPGGLTTARIYRKKDNGAYAIYQSIPIGTSYTDSNLTDGTYCYQVTVVASNGIESAKSNEACKTVDTRTPGAVTNLTVN